MLKRIKQVLQTIITFLFMVVAIPALVVLLKDDEDLEEDWEC
jgi:hypothetical protein